MTSNNSSSQWYLEMAKRYQILETPLHTAYLRVRNQWWRWSFGRCRKCSRQWISKMAKVCPMLVILLYKLKLLAKTQGNHKKRWRRGCTESCRSHFRQWIWAILTRNRMLMTLLSKLKLRAATQANRRHKWKRGCFVSWRSHLMQWMLKTSRSELSLRKVWKHWNFEPKINATTNN